MFKKKRKVETEVMQEVVEDKVIEVTSKDISEALSKSDKKRHDKPSKFFSFDRKEEPEDVVTTKKAKQEISQDQSRDEFNWTNNPEYEEQLAKDNKKKKRRKKNKEEPQVIEETINKEEKKELSAYFETNKDNSKKGKRKGKALKTTKKSNKKSKHKSKKNKLEEDIKNQKLFKYEKKKYTKVEDFITYLNEHYLDIEKISAEVLDNENFFGWINKNSGMFNQSLKEFKEIKDKIENKS